MNAGKTTNQRCSVHGLELIEIRAIHHSGYDFSYVIGLACILGDNAVNFPTVVKRLYRLGDVALYRLSSIQPCHCLPSQLQSMMIILSVMISHARLSTMYICTTQLFSSNNFTSGCFYQWRTREEYSALVANNDGFVSHGRYIGTTRSTGTHDHSNLGNILRRHISLVEKDSAKMFSIRENLIL